MRSSRGQYLDAASTGAAAGPGWGWVRRASMLGDVLERVSTVAHVRHRGSLSQMA